MGKIDVNLLEAGMELEDDAREAKGLVLLPAGTVITEKHIGILKSWDVPEVAVKGATQGDLLGREAAKVDPAKREEISKQLAEIFRHTDREDPATQEIFRYCLIRAADTDRKPI